VRSFLRSQYGLVTAATATGLIKARSILLHRDLDSQMYGSTIRAGDGRLVNPSPLLVIYRLSRVSCCFHRHPKRK
jgi:hypothetical protein